MMLQMPFKVGATIVLRETCNGEVWAERPVRVVQDDDDLIALWLPRGTRWRKPATLEGGPCRIPVPPWKLIDAEWRRFEILQLIPHGGRSPYALWASWDQQGAWAGCYVNMQDPLRRVSDGFEYLDHALDLLLPADGSHQWKDEDELEEYVGRGVLSVAEAVQVRRDAEAVLRMAHGQEGVFADSWSDWRADLAWPIPSFDQVGASD